MFAISLVPLTVVGTAYPQGDWASGSGALLLFATNMLATLVMGGLTFVVASLRSSAWPTTSTGPNVDRSLTVDVRLIVEERDVATSAG